MSGPTYPSPGPNGIGAFSIGVSPIGTQPPFDYWDTVLSQYANSPILTQLIANFFQYIDQTQNMDAFFDNIWNIDTAVGYGLDVWGRIVGVNRVLQIPIGKYFGFEEAGTLSADPYNQSPFYTGTQLTSNFALSDEAFRTLILAKALANILDGSIPSINQLLLNIFSGRGNCYVQEASAPQFFSFEEMGPPTEGFNQAPFYVGQPLSVMSIAYVFEFALTPVDLAIVSQSGVLPTPTGVFASVIVL